MEFGESHPPFADRADAGRQLGRMLAEYAGEDAIVLGLARGGVEVGAVVASILGLPFRPLIVRKVGAPENPELGLGAVGETGVRWLDPELVRRTGATDAHLHAATQASVAEIERQSRVYALTDLAAAVHDRVAIVVDDGIATGGTTRAAIETVREAGARSVVVAAPVASTDAVRMLQGQRVTVVVVTAPKQFRAVGWHYQSFEQVSDAQVIQILSGFPAVTVLPPASGMDSQEITVATGSVELLGVLSIPLTPSGLVVFAHGSGSGRNSPRNRRVADVLNAAGIATFLPDLLTEEEARDRRAVFDIPLLAGRLAACVDRATGLPQLVGVPYGLFGASTGAAAALVAARERGGEIRAVVSRGGRVDLAGRALERVRCPTLLLVGGEDRGVIALNQHAFDRLQCEKRLTLIPGATHLFEEAGTLDLVADRACEWFASHFGA